MPRSAPAPTRRRLAVLAAALVVAPALALTACAGPGSAAGGAAPSGSAAATGTPVEGGTLRFALGASPTGVDPQQVGTNVSIYIARQLADSLTDQDLTTGELKPWLATKWEVSKDLKQFTFHLRDDVTFSDGTPLTATTVKANFDALAGPLGASAPLAASYLAGYKSTKVVDPHTVTVTFGAPNAQFLQATSTVTLAILSDATTTADPAARLQGKIVGSGPFVLKSYTQDKGAVLTKRDDYNWASGVAAHDGPAHLDEIDFSIVPESGVRAGGLASGQFDAIGDVLPQDVQQISAAGGQVLNRTNPGVAFVLQPNVTRGPLADVAVRRAVSQAINRQELVDTVLSDAFKPATSVLASTTPGYEDLSAKLAFNADAAAKALDAAGWTKGPDGIRAKGGKKLSFDVVFAPNFTGSQAVLELVQQQLRKVGVDLKLRQLTAAEQTTAQTSGDYDTYYYNVTRADGDILRPQFGTQGVNLNKRGADKTLDPLLTTELTQADPAARAATIAKAQEAIIDQAYAIPLFELAQSIGVAKGVNGVAFDASSRLVFHDAWIAKH